MARPRVLTFNFHEPYLCLMAKTGLPFTVGLYESGEMQRPWHTNFRPIPQNITLMPEAEWRQALQQGKFDVVVAHNEINAASVFLAPVPALLVCHNRRSFIRGNFPPDVPHELEAYDRLIARLRDRFEFIYISESKRDDYGVPGRIILPGIDVGEYGGYEGDVPEVLRVGNSMRERNRMFDVDLQEAVTAGLATRVLGINPSIPGSRSADSFEDLLWHYRHLRVYLHVSRQDWEDGYNLAMLEAMACGMPVVALANGFSPFMDGRDLLTADGAAGLRDHVNLLLRDLDHARALGARGREAVAREFPLERFVDSWRRALEEAADTTPVKQTTAPADTRVGTASQGQRHVSARPTRTQPPERPMIARAESPVQDRRLEVGGYYRSPRPELAAHVPQNTRRLLDVGCGAGEFGRALKHERGVQEVTGIEIVEDAWRIAQGALDEAILGNIETMDIPFPEGYFDCITCGDVLEHLVHPQETLKKLSRVLSADGVIIASVPNVRFYQVVEMLANGRWTYMDAGIMDRTHLRFFTAVEMVELIQAGGLELRTIAPLSMINKEAVPITDDGYIQLQKLRLGPLTQSEYHDFLVYQYLVIAGKKSQNLLKQARRHLDAKENEQALRVARQAREGGENEAQCLHVMGKASARLGGVDEAESYYREALRLQPEDAELRGEHGIVLFAQGRCVDARAELETANRELPDHPKILSGLGLCDLASGNLEGAFARFRESLDADFDNEAAVEHLVGVAKPLNRLEEAEPYVRRFVEFYPGNLDMGCVHAAVLIELDRLDAARERLANVLLFDARHERALALLTAIAEG